MFANRFTALVDACVLVSALKRNILLSLAEAEFFRVRWSEEILNETQNAIRKIREKKGLDEPHNYDVLTRMAMENAFKDAMVDNYEPFMASAACLPDPSDRHVLAAALKIKADTIVTDNLKDFPDNIVSGMNLEVRSADGFIADTIALDPARAALAIRTMRERFKRPEITAEKLLEKMEAYGLVEAADTLMPLKGMI